MLLKDGNIEIRNQDTLIAFGKRKGNLFKINFDIIYDFIPKISENFY